jgi:catechol 2,3-dioxygenase-like lactoylglutathione lyase family enzyme
VITGAHAIIFTKDAEGVRSFRRDTLGLSSVDAGGGWPMFGLPPAELAVHPTDDETHDELYLMTDDLYATVAALETKGVKFTPIRDAGWGLLTSLELPDGRELGLYEPKNRPGRAASASEGRLATTDGQAARRLSPSNVCRNPW